MVSKYVVRYIVGDDPRSQEAILLAQNKEEATKQLVSDLEDIVDYVKVIKVTDKAQSQENIESFFKY